MRSFLQKPRVLALVLAGLSVAVAVAFVPGQGVYEGSRATDEVFGLPMPPVTAGGGGPGAFDARATGIATVLFAILFAVAVLWGLVESVRRRSLIPVALSLSGIPCVLAELNLDVMGGVVYANAPDGVVFTLMGRDMGWFVIAAWAAYGGLFAHAAYQVFSRPHLSNRAIWLGLLLVCIGQAFFEELLGHFDGIYYYYGNQPLTPFTQFPWWIILATSGGVCLLATLTYRFRTSFTGLRAVAVVVIAPFTFCGFMGMVSLPAWIAVNSDLGRPVTQLLGLASVAAGLVAFAVVMRLVLERDPLDPRGTGTAF